MSCGAALQKARWGQTDLRSSSGQKRQQEKAGVGLKCQDCGVADCLEQLCIGDTYKGNNRALGLG